MLGAAAAIAWLILMVWILQSVVRAWGRPDETTPITFWTALGHMFTASLLGRLVNWLLKTQDMPLRVSLAVAAYILVLTALLVGYSKATPIRAALISILFAAILITSLVAAVMTGLLG